MLKLVNYTPKTMTFKRLLISATVIAAFIMPSSRAVAQPKSLGAVFSFTGVAISMETPLKQNTNVFLELNLKAECNEFYASRTEYPGVSASASLNYILKQWRSNDNNQVCLFAGPGLILGYGADYKLPDGILFGLKGIVGLQCNFKRNVTVSTTIAPVIGSHSVFKNEAVEMKYYRIGLQYGLIPEIGIKYRF